MSHVSVETLIIGAGMAGLSAARELQGRGRSVLVVDKAKGVGGRIATRRMDGFRFDHGAQYFTASDAAFTREVNSWVDAGAAKLWSTGFYLMDGLLKSDSTPRYCGVAGMTSIAKHLARGIPIRLPFKIESVSLRSGLWHAADGNGGEIVARQILFTSPVEQSLALLQAGGVSPDNAALRHLSGIRYTRCLAFLALLKGSSGIPDPGGIWGDANPITWLADNSRKGLNPPSQADRGTLTIHTGPEFSMRHWDSSPEAIKEELTPHIERWTHSGIDAWQVHKWKFAQCEQCHPNLYSDAGKGSGLFFAGDGFGGAKVEGAWLSGTAVAHAILNRASG